MLFSQYKKIETSFNTFWTYCMWIVCYKELYKIKVKLVWDLFRINSLIKSVWRCVQGCQLPGIDLWLCVCTVRPGLGYVRAIAVCLPSGQSVLCGAVALVSPATLPGFIKAALSGMVGRSTILIVLARQTQPDLWKNGFPLTSKKQCKKWRKKKNCVKVYRSSPKVCS